MLECRESQEEVEAQAQGKGDGVHSQNPGETLKSLSSFAFLCFCHLSLNSPFTILKAIDIHHNQ